MQNVDVIVAPTSSSQLLATNLTGHPALIMPHGFRPEDGTPLSITFLGQLFGEEKLLKLGQAFQRVTTHHQKHPTLA
jgi:Asp-tRNA(Asn)/Glu-tRNA(Gln) amidotransferase A subunit family amidase